MSFDVMEEGTPCDYCGQPVGFMDDDEVVCPTCRAEYSNMDYTGDEIIEDEIGEWNTFVDILLRTLSFGHMIGTIKNK